MRSLVPLGLLVIQAGKSQNVLAGLFDIVTQGIGLLAALDGEKIAQDADDPIPEDLPTTESHYHVIRDVNFESPMDLSDYSDSLREQPEVINMPSLANMFITPEFGGALRSTLLSTLGGIFSGLNSSRQESGFQGYDNPYHDPASNYDYYASPMEVTEILSRDDHTPSTNLRKLEASNGPLARTVGMLSSLEEKLNNAVPAPRNSAQPPILANLISRTVDAVRRVGARVDRSPLRILDSSKQVQEGALCSTHAKNTQMIALSWILEGAPELHEFFTRLRSMNTEINLDTVSELAYALLCESDNHPNMSIIRDEVDENASSRLSNGQTSNASSDKAEKISGPTKSHIREPTSTNEPDVEYFLSNAHAPESYDELIRLYIIQHTEAPKARDSSVHQETLTIPRIQHMVRIITDFNGTSPLTGHGNYTLLDSQTTHGFDVRDQVHPHRRLQDADASDEDFVDQDAVENSPDGNPYSRSRNMSSASADFSVSPLDSSRMNNSPYELNSEVDCIIPAVTVVGEEELVVRANDLTGCQKLCKMNKKCEYCTFRSDERLCYHYSNADSLRGMRSAASAPKRCQNELQGDVLPYISTSPPSSETVRQEAVGGLLDTGLLSNLLGGSGLASLFTGGLNFGNTVQAASNFITTGSQLMNALPLKELADVAKSDVGPSRRFKSGPPAGLAKPQVVCHAQGMTCCIPRIHDWQRQTPYLNTYSDQDVCQAIYVSNQDQLCVTSVYSAMTDKDRCGVIIREAGDITLYRNILTVPQKGVNNAICECVVDKNAEQDKTQGSARWEYSINAAKEEQTKDRNASNKIAKGAQLANLLTNSGGTNDRAGGAPALGALMSLFSSLVKLR